MKMKREDTPPEEREQSDEELLKEAEWAAEHISDDAVPQSAPDEFEKIWRRVQEQREE